MKVFKLPAAPLPPPYDAEAYQPAPYQPQSYPAGPYTPAVLVCPADVAPYESHSYVLNAHLADRAIRAGKSGFGGLSSAEVIVAGEKVTLERDYSMQNQNFGRVVETARHGRTRGSNYLYFDGHVGTVLPREALTGIDPWDLRTPVAGE
jgi:prepilin-type processing-associated H-X9-DG protein